MADVKISALPAATTPLAGTEVLPIVQSATTDQVSVANLTAGRAVSAASLTLTTTPLAVGSGGTGFSSITSGYIPYATGTNTLGSSSGFTFVGVNLQQDNTGTARTTHHFGSTGGNLYVGVESSAGGAVFTGSSAYAGILGTDNSTPLQFFTNSAVRATITTAGNVGIGTTTPSQLLVVSSGGAQGIEISPTATASAPAIVCYNRATSAYISLTQFASKFDWYIGASPAMTLDASGNLGIATTSPSQKLHVYGNILSDTASSTNYYAQVAGTTYTQFLTTASATTLKTIVANPLILGTNDTERARIDSSGNLLVGTTSTLSGNRNNFVTSVDAQLILRQSNSTAGKYWFVGPSSTSQFLVLNQGSVGVTLTDGATAWAASSDIRLKNIIGGYANAIDDINKITPIKFTWKTDVNNVSRTGVSAQSVQTAVPEAVDVDKDGYLSVRYTEILPLVIASIQELAAKVAELEAKI